MEKFNIRDLGLVPLVLIFLAAILVLGGIYKYISSEQSLPKSEESSEVGEIPLEEQKNTESPVAGEEAPKPQTPIAPKPLTYKDPWSLIAQKLAYLEKNDQAGFYSLNHYQNPFCDETDPECQKLIAATKNSMRNMLQNKDNFTTRWEDSKQLILVSELTPEDKYHTRKSIFFTKDSSGNLKYLSKYDYTSLKVNLVDADKDGKIDPHETCSLNFENCQKTNPEKRDTDLDGWWDGTELFIRQ